MKLWTIQPSPWFEKLLAEGSLSGERKYIDRGFLPGYAWMVASMERLIGGRPNPDAFPIWAWYQYMDSSQKRPDLRRRGHLPAGTEGVLIEIEKAENEVLLSDFELWHFPLSFHSYIADSEEDDEAFEKLIIQDLKAGKNLIEKSWEKVLDMDYCTPYAASSREEKRIQATFWTIKKEEIIRVKRFIAR
ncbi:MAG: DUF3841 domain-containing protein [Thiotrichaceae bacterium]